MDVRIRCYIAAVVCLVLWCHTGSAQYANSSACLQDFSTAILASAQDPSVTNHDVAIQNITTAYLAGCLQQVSVAKPVQVLMSASYVNLPVLTQLTEEFTQSSGHTVQLAAGPSGSYLNDVIFQVENNVSDLYDAYFLKPVGLAELDPYNGFADLATFIGGDLDLDYLDIHPFYLRSESSYQGRVVGLPLDGKMIQLFYRRDLFANNSLQVPETWDQLADLVDSTDGRDWNGDGQPDYAFCVSHQQNCIAGKLLMSAASQYLQYQGTEQGAFLCPDTLQPLVNNPGMAAALGIWARLANHSTPVDSSVCTEVHPLFLSGRCLMTIHYGNTFKQSEVGLGTVIKGLVATAQLPGSSLVLNRGSNTLVPCSTANCSYAAPSATNSSVLLNRAPYPGVGGYTSVIVRTITPTAKYSAYQYLSYLAQPDTAWDRVLWGNSTTDPFRLQHFDPGHLSRWTAAGYDPTDTAQYLESTSSALNSPNIVLPLRVPGGTNIGLVYDDAMEQLFSNVNATAIMAGMYTSVLAALAAAEQATGLSQGDMLTLYRSELGYDVNPDNAGSSQSFVGSAGFYLAIFAPPIGLVLLALGLRWGWKRFLGRHRTLFGTVVAPGVGPNTTLVVTDIENSTTLWETLPAEVMDQALQMHHATIRSLLVKHVGYESATEGDSFIASFHSPEHALRFAVDVQKELAMLPWPRPLTELASCRPTYVVNTSCDQNRLSSQSGVLAASLIRRDTEPTQRDTSSEASLFQYIRSHSDVESRHTSRDPSSLNSVGSIMTTAGTHLRGFLRKLLQLEEDDEDADEATVDVSVHNNAVVSQNERCSFEEACGREWRQTFFRDDPQRVLAFAGLRVRIGLHSGVEDRADIKRNAATNRMEYSGEALANARSVCGAAHGGMVLLSEAAFRRLPMEQLADQLVLCHMGEYTLKGCNQSLGLYQALDKTLRCRLALFEPIRFLEQLSSGVLQAPVGSAAIVFMQVVGSKTLLAWNHDMATAALETFYKISQELLLQHYGYMVECASGLLLTSFSSPAEAIMWSLQVADRMLHQDWPPQLLEHELCEEITVSQLRQGQDFEEMDTAGVLLFRGPRLRTGIDHGSVHHNINTVSGRMAYRGRVMNRSSRISMAAATSQVCCSRGAWELAESELGPGQDALAATSLGMFDLKGIVDKLEVFACRMSSGPRRRTASLGSGDTQSARSIGGASASGDLDAAVAVRTFRSTVSFKRSSSRRATLESPEGDGGAMAEEHSGAFHRPQRLMLSGGSRKSMLDPAAQPRRNSHLQNSPFSPGSQLEHVQEASGDYALDVDHLSEFNLLQSDLPFEAPQHSPRRAAQLRSKPHEEADTTGAPSLVVCSPFRGSSTAAAPLGRHSIGASDVYANAPPSPTGAPRRGNMPLPSERLSARLTARSGDHGVHSSSGAMPSLGVPPPFHGGSGAIASSRRRNSLLIVPGLPDDHDDRPSVKSPRQVDHSSHASSPPCPTPPPPPTAPDVAAAGTSAGDGRGGEGQRPGKPRLRVAI